jgi:uncharacterized protein (DUF1015 family)
MTEIRPFAALRFAREPEPRLAPPWDVIGDEERAGLAREPENVVHLTLPPGPEGERDYAAARRTLAGWLERGVLVRDAGERIYLLRERIADGRVRRGLLALLRLADYAEGVVLPHERTMAHARRDRLLLTREVRANLEPLFFLYEDRDRKLDAALDEVQAGERLAACAGPGDTQLELYGAPGDAALRAVRSFLAERPVVIADGHHRYDTMLRYRDERRAEEGVDHEAGWEFVLAYLVNAFDPGSEIRASHRVLRGRLGDPDRVLSEAGFSVEALPDDAPAAALLERIGARREAEHAFAIVGRGGARLARRPRGGRLDVEVLHEELLPALGGEPVFDAEAERATAAARSGAAALTVLMNPLRAEELFSVVQAGGLLPQKSTYFAPKVPSGLVLRDFAPSSGEPHT